MSKNLKKIIIIGVVVIALVYIGGIYANKWVAIKMQKIQLGLAESNFPYRDYTEAELAKMYPQIRYADVATRVTPEETYANFRYALKNNKLEMALEQLSGESEKYNENIKILIDAYNQGKFAETYLVYPEKIEKSSTYGSIANYYFLEKREDLNLRQYVGFLKDANGDWKLNRTTQR